jgi:hypothetical protein
VRGGANQLAADGKRHGIAVSDFLLHTTKYKKRTIAAAVDLAASTVDRQASEMLEGGRTRQEVLAWVRAVRQALVQRVTGIVGLVSERPSSSPRNDSG